MSSSPPGHRPGLFVTGTDTGVGKTAVCRALLRLARRRGRRAIPFKPAETGRPSHAPAGDADHLWEAAGRPVPRDAVCLYALVDPVAPAVAAAAAGVTIALDAIADRAAFLAAAGDTLIVESAGGLLVPYAPGVTGADIAARLGLAVLVVARAALGTINHTALTIAELRRRSLPIAGIVLVETTPEPTPDRPTNAAAIAELTGIRPLGTLPFITPMTTDTLTDALVQSIDVAPLLA